RRAAGTGPRAGAAATCGRTAAIRGPRASRPPAPRRLGPGSGPRGSRSWAVPRSVVGRAGYPRSRVPSAPQSPPLQAFPPDRRVLRRVLRPMLFRLRDLLQVLHDRQQEDRAAADATAREVALLTARADALAREVDALRRQLGEALHRTAELERRLLIDLSALDGRVAGAEDDFLRALAGPVS